MNIPTNPEGWGSAPTVALERLLPPASRGAWRARCCLLVSPAGPVERGHVPETEWEALDGADVKSSHIIYLLVDLKQAP